MTSTDIVQKNTNSIEQKESALFHFVKDSENTYHCLLKMNGKFNKNFGE